MNLSVEELPDGVTKAVLAGRMDIDGAAKVDTQLNVLGVAGVMAGLEEGLEINVLGLTFGIDPKSLGLKLPLIGRIALRGETFPSRLQPNASAPEKTL